jgi:hemerythrin-like domain-containing protein
LAKHRVTGSGVGVIKFFAADHLRIREQCQRLETFASGIHNGILALDEDESMQLIDYFNVEARRHHQQEETTLFPRLRALPLEDADRVQLIALIDALVFDHRELDRLWLAVCGELKALLRDFGERDVDRVAHLAARQVSTFVALNLHHVNREDTGIMPLVSSHIADEELILMLEEISARDAAGLH